MNVSAYPNFAPISLKPKTASRDFSFAFSCIPQSRVFLFRSRVTDIDMYVGELKNFFRVYIYRRVVEG